MDFGLLDLALKYVGIATAVYYAYSLLTFVKVNYLSSVNLKKKYGKAGSWAVVTGASDGIGRGFAEVLAKQGMNVCIIARTKSKLDEVAEEITKRGVQVKVITFDFSDATSLQYKKLFNELDTIEIGMLVNNVGISTKYPQYFEEVDIEEHMRMVKVNCESQLQMTQYVLPKMKAKKAGALVNLSSTTAQFPTGLLATYAATKSFNGALSEALQQELAKFNIDTLNVTPNAVSTTMTQGVGKRKPKTSFIIVDAKTMAANTLSKLGSTSQNAGHSNHAILEGIFRLLPGNMARKHLTDVTFGARKRALKRLESEKASN